MKLNRKMKVSGLLIAGFLVGSVPYSALASIIGDYEGNGCDGVQNAGIYQKWSGKVPSHIQDFFDYQHGWQGLVDDAGWTVNCWKNAGFTDPSAFTFSVGLSLSGGSMDDVLRGDGDWAYLATAQKLVDGGYGSSFIRLGWEMNKTNYPWAAAGQESKYVDTYRHVADLFRSINGQNFKFDWCPDAGWGDINYDNFYPGTKYVDIIGMDVYAVSWGNNNPSAAQVWNSINSNYSLDFLPSLAAKYGKRMALDEWGVGDRPNGSDNYGPGDSPEVMSKMLDWISTHDLVYATYWDFNAGDYNSKISNGERPNEGKVFKDFLNSNGNPTPPAPVVSDATVVGAVSLKVRQSSQCLDNGGNASNGQVALQWDCYTGDNQTWNLKKFNDGSYSLVNAGSQKCLDVDGASGSDGAKIQGYDCYGNPNQRFWIWPTSQGGYSISNVGSNKCLDMAWGTYDHGVAFSQYGCSQADNQIFDLTMIWGSL